MWLTLSSQNCAVYLSVIFNIYRVYTLSINKSFKFIDLAIQFSTIGKYFNKNDIIIHIYDGYFTFSIIQNVL